VLSSEEATNKTTTLQPGLWLALFGGNVRKISYSHFQVPCPAISFDLLGLAPSPAYVSELTAWRFGLPYLIAVSRETLVKFPVAQRASNLTLTFFTPFGAVKRTLGSEPAEVHFRFPPPASLLLAGRGSAYNMG
jgi:hypothetical protein